MDEFDQLFAEYRLTQAEILYLESGGGESLQSVVWEDYDVAPDYPELKRFLGILLLHLDGTLQAVRVTDLNKVRPFGQVYAPGSLALQ